MTILDPGCPHFRSGLHQANKENARDVAESVCCKPSRVDSLASMPSQGGHGSVSLADVRKHITCGVCSGMLASSLVLSCGHIFCGGCLFE